LLTHEHLSQRFPGLVDLGDGVLKCKDVVPAYTFHYYVRPASTSEGPDLLMVSENREDDELARSVLTQPGSPPLKKDKLAFWSMPAGFRFTRLLLVPPSYHSYFSGRFDELRGHLLLCVPVYESEFSGDESRREFGDVYLRLVPTRDWSRSECPKVVLRFDNPATGAGTVEGRYVRSSYRDVCIEIDELRTGGFIEVLNHRGRVLEVLPDGNGRFRLIRDRDETGAVPVEKSVLVEQLWKFLTE
jgi:hypothetical protein